MKMKSMHTTNGTTLLAGGVTAKILPTIIAIDAKLLARKRPRDAPIATDQ